MKKVKKIGAITLLSVLLALSITACGNTTQVSKIDNQSKSKSNIELPDSKSLNTEELKDKMKNKIVEKEMSFNTKNNKGLR